MKTQRGRTKGVALLLDNQREGIVDAVTPAAVRRPVADRQLERQLTVPEAAQRTRVLLFTNSVCVGGMEKHVELIARDLDRTQAEVFAVVPQWEQIDSWAERMAQVSDHFVRLSPDRRHGPLAELQDTYRLWRLLREWRIQVMHMHLTTYRGGLWALCAARLAEVPVVMCTEHLAPEVALFPPERLLRDLLTRNFDQLICVSEQNRQARESHLYTPAEKTTVVNNGIDVTPFEPIAPREQAALRARLGIPDGAPVVGTVVRFEAEKGLTYLLEAMPGVLAAAPDAYLLMVGDGTARGDLERQATDLGIRDRVLFPGFQSDPRPYLSLMNAFVLPVPVGSASIGLLEAMAMRRAVIITFGGEDEPVIDGETGLRRPPRDPVALADAIHSVLLHPELERRLGENARRHVETHFSSRSVASHLLTLYRTLYQS